MWSPELAYAIGLLVTDGSLSKDGRHIILVSKDLQQLKNFKKALGLRIKVSHVRSGYTGMLTTRVQFGDIFLYRFLLEIGLTPNKTKTIGKIKIPSQYFFDFLRGHLDGDGCTYSYWDPRWPSSFMFYLTFVSASKKHIYWLRDEILDKTGIPGHITGDEKKSFFHLRYAKKGSLALIRKMYSTKKVLCLPRKRLKIRKMLSIVGERL